MIILYDVILTSIHGQFNDIDLIPPRKVSNLAGYSQSSMIVRCDNPLAITAELYPGPPDWITVIRFFSALRSYEQGLFRINENLSNNTVQFAWNKAKTYIITRIDESELFSVSLTEKPFLIESPLMLPRNEVVDKLISAIKESYYARDN